MARAEFGAEAVGAVGKRVLMLYGMRKGNTRHNSMSARRWGRQALFHHLWLVEAQTSGTLQSEAQTDDHA